MRNSTKFALTTLAAAALFGTAGAVGTSVASADTVTNMVPSMNNGAYCKVVTDDGDELLLFSLADCSQAKSDIAAEERAADDDE